MSRGFRHRAAAQVLRSGGVIAHPTEAVYGLACDPARAGAVQRILTLKHRPAAKGLILIADRADRFAGWVAAGVLSAPEVGAGWPGPVTWILPSGPMARAQITGNHPGLAVRVTSHPTSAALCHAFGGPLVSTSANPAGAAPARSALRLRCYFGKQLDFIIGGATGGRTRPSEIRAWPDGRILRHG